MYHFWYIGLCKKAKAFSSFVKKGAQCTIFGTLSFCFLMILVISTSFIDGSEAWLLDLYFCPLLVVSRQLNLSFAKPCVAFQREISQK